MRRRSGLTDVLMMRTTEIAGGSETLRTPQLLQLMLLLLVVVKQVSDEGGRWSCDAVPLSPATVDNITDLRAVFASLQTSRYPLFRPSSSFQITSCAVAFVVVVTSRSVPAATAAATREPTEQPR